MYERHKLHTYEGETPEPRTMITQSADTFTERELSPAEQAVHKVLSEVDNTTLHNILAAYYSKSGYDPSRLSLIPLPTINIVTEHAGAWSGKYTANPAKISLNAAHLYDSQSQKTDTIAVINTLIHEQLHHVSSILYNEVDKGKTTIKNISGVQIIRDVTYNGYFRSIFERGRFINEGITQLLTEKIQQEYLRQIGWQNSDDSFERLGIGIDAYLENQFRIQLLIAFYSTLATVPEETVTNAIIRTYMRNGRISPVEIEELIAFSMPYDKGDIARILTEMLDDENTEALDLIETLIELLPQEKQALFKVRADQILENYTEALQKSVDGF